MANTVDLATLAIKVESLEAELAAKRLENLGREASGAEQASDRLSTSTRELVTRFASFAAVGAAVGAFLNQSIRAYAELEKATANLAANTGLAGAELEFMVERAKDLSASSTQTAASILDAAEQVEGLIPSLSGNAEAIAEVTRQAIILAEATGDELEPSVFALGQALEQFGGDADTASRYVNVLVAAAQNGAAGVQDLADSMQRVGPAAGRAGITFEQTASLIEILANRGIRGREAVGGLTEFLDRLATTTEARFSPALVGLETALENIATAGLTAEERTKLFGDSAGNVAATLADARTEVADLTAKVTGTTAALDQAATQLGTLEARSAAAKNQITNLASEVGEQLSPYLVEASEAGGQLADMLRDVIDVEGGATDASQLFGDALSGIALTIGTTAQIIGALVDVTRLFGTITLSVANFLTGNFSAALGTASEAWDDYVARVNERVKEVGEAYDSIANGVPRPGDRGLLDAQPEAAAGDPDAAAEAAAREAERVAEAKRRAEREAQAAAAKEVAEANARRLELLRDLEDESLALLEESTARRVALEVESEFERIDAIRIAEEEIANIRLERLEELGERMREYFETDLEATLRAYDEKEAAIQEYYDSVTFPNEAERQRRLRELAEQRERAVSEVARRGTINRDDFDKLSSKQKTEFLLGQAVQLTAGLAQHNKAAFEANKIASIALAVVNTATGATKALRDWGFPLGPVFAGLITAAGLAQIQAIRSTTFEGGGGGTTPSAVGGSASVNGNPVDTNTTAPPPQIGGAQGSGRQVQIIVAGNTILDDSGLDSLVDRIREGLEDRDLELFSENSRQAQDIVVTRGT